jgi:hypothetical protein
LLETQHPRWINTGVVVTICTQLTLKKIISLEQNLNECRVLITGERETVNQSGWEDVCKVSKTCVKSDPALGGSQLRLQMHLDPNFG